MDNLNNDILSYTTEYLSRQQKRMRRHKIVRFLITIVVVVVLGAVCVFILSRGKDWYVTSKSVSEEKIEFKSEWECAGKQVYLTGDWSEDVLALAESQLGYSDTSSEDWSAVFASFCLNYAKVDGVPLETDCNRWVQKLREDQYALYQEVDEYIPMPGDLVFFEMNDPGSRNDSDASSDQKIADHVGLVAEVIPATGAVPSKIKTIEGDSDDSVQYVVYDFSDERIMGFGELPKEAE